MAMLLAVSCQTTPGGPGNALGERFLFEDNGKSLTLLENGKPVLEYRYTRVDPPQGAPEKFWRMSYIHPLYGLDGDILTQDFPDDHYHHRGVFWTWPNCTAGEKYSRISRQLLSSLAPPRWHSSMTMKSKKSGG